MTTRILTGDCRDVLVTLPLQSVQTCVTSPPYFGLRDYGVAGQIGLEPTPDAYVAELVAVFREVRRVLADDGTVWLNLGDSYAATTGQKTITPQTAYVTGRAGGNPRAAPSKTLHYEASAAGFKNYGALKPKDLIGIPWRVAFALQADGWYLRSDVIWHKPNPMPESVRDRPTKAHEYVFLLSKSPSYFYDAAAIAEPCSENSHGSPNINPGRKQAALGANQSGTLGRWTAEDKERGRNARSVWTIAPKPFRGAHFATFPPALAERCIRAGSRPGDTVLDPFAGAGTTLMAAAQMQRNAVGVELNPAYAAMAEARIAEAVGMLAA